MQSCCAVSNQVRLVFERASIREWEQQVVADAPPAAGARVGSTCSAGASTAEQGSDTCGAGRSLVVSYSAAHQVCQPEPRVPWDNACSLFIP